MELIIVLLVIGVLMTIGIPQYMISSERARSAEALLNLEALRYAQIRYKAENGSFANNLSLIDIEIMQAQHFNSPGVRVNNPIATIRRNSLSSSYCGQYTLGIADDGGVGCSGSSNNCCAKFGFMSGMPSYPPLE